jgi:UDP-3-O-[3-hydroxymyristoyl] glucosamine N-acyltransferase
MIAAMSFVNEDVESNTLEGGVPIHIIKHYKRTSQKIKKA